MRYVALITSVILLCGCGETPAPSPAPELVPQQESALPPIPPPEKPAEPKPQENPDLSAAFSITSSGSLRVDNNDDFDWTDCTAKINTKALSFQGFRSSTPLVKAHQIAFMPLNLFTDGDGVQFDYGTRNVMNVYLHCSTPRGEASVFRKSDQSQ
jgi:hypothetical protein